MALCEKRLYERENSAQENSEINHTACESAIHTLKVVQVVHYIIGHHPVNTDGMGWAYENKQALYLA